MKRKTAIVLIAISLALVTNGTVLANERPWGKLNYKDSPTPSSPSASGYQGRYNPWTGEKRSSQMTGVYPDSRSASSPDQRGRVAPPYSQGPGYGFYPGYGFDPYGGYGGIYPGGAGGHYSPYSWGGGYPYYDSYSPFGGSGWGGPFNSFGPGLFNW